MTNYKKTHTTTSLLNYHFIFCPRYRRKIFLIEGLEAYFKQCVAEICADMEIDVLAMECQIDHAHLFLSCLPTHTPAIVMQKIKGITSLDLRERFPELERAKSLWTRNYFVSTAGSVSSETIKAYVEAQKKRD